MLKPLGEWICDSCHQVIRSPRDGYVEWLASDEAGRHQFSDFYIVHHAPKSPRRPSGDCYHHTRARGRMDLSLDSFVGPNGIVTLTSFLDVGAYHDPRQEDAPRVANFREFAEIFRRLHVPYYEEARLYWERADSAGFFDGANEVWPYLPENLREIIQRFQNK